MASDGEKQQATITIAPGSDDYYSAHAVDYSKYRQTYPRELFELLSTLTADHSLAFDVATGNGQSARSLSDYYTSVIATDRCAAQLAHADRSKSNVIYKHLPAELSNAEMAANGLEPRTFDLITVSSAVHWFNVDAFNRVVKYLLKPKTGLYAAWCVGAPTIDNAEVQAAFERCICPQGAAHLSEKVKDYMLSRYAKLEFPFVEVALPKTFEFDEEWDQEHFLGK